MSSDVSTAAATTSSTITNTSSSDLNDNLIQYLSRLKQPLIDKLYTSSATSLAVYRELPELAKHYVMRLLFVDQTIPQAVIASWVKNISEHNEASEVLTRLHVWKSQTLPTGLPGWLLNPCFRDSLKVALLGGGEQWSLYKDLSKDKHAPDVEYLDSYANKRWESMLNFMVERKQQNPENAISLDTKKVLIQANLIRLDDPNDIPDITANGFQFLLMDVMSQVWHFLVKYLETLQTKGLDLAEALIFLFQLSFLTLGKNYSTESMSDSNLSILQNLREFGLVYQRKRKDGRFYPTRLAINLVSGLKEAPVHTKRPGFIIVETNYRVYAYTDSPIQIALLSIFTEMQYRFPKFVLGAITRESCRQAYKFGINAKQIVNFLVMHSHPELQKQNPIVPATVVDQISLWEQERDRLVYTDGVLYSQFNSQPDFDLLKKYANDLGVLIWSNPMRRVMVVTNEGHDEVRRFWKRHKKDH
ncbi:general transcription factor IIH subunit 4-like [Oppia nitens]|uniref:general transcription factor IIH subunit 4-like n=1 Tax=Oppia nitens TaxID=1686743 RepID=UPI0023DB54FA|nr:general transcription factor IIH subunit 4-like [Oppia nitens]